MKYTLFLSCIRGFEDNCKKDLEQQGIQDTSIQDGGVLFTGILADIYKINYSSRYGMHLYWEITNFAFNEKKLSDAYKPRQGLGLFGYIFLIIIIGFSIVGVLRTFEEDLLNTFPETEYIFTLLDEQLEYLAESVKNLIVIINDLINSY